MRNNFRDKSNERIIDAIKELMKKEDRGFLFCPIPQEKGNHRTFLVFAMNNDGDPAEVQFFATMMAVMENVRLNIPENDYKKWKKAYLAYLQHELTLWNMGLLKLVEGE